MAQLKKGHIPGAIWDPITARSVLANKIERMTIHIAVSRAGDIYGPGKGPGGTYAHCYNPKDAPLRQHQELHHKAYADLNANGRVVAVEHEGWPGDSLTAGQIERDAQLFAYLVMHKGMPNRIATVDDTRGLAWHRLGCQGNFGTFSASNRRTWSTAQTGQRWSTAYGKTCPTDKYIDAIQAIYDRAQEIIGGKIKPVTKPTTKAKKVKKTADLPVVKANIDPKIKGKYEWPWHKLQQDGDYGPITRRAYQRLLAPAKVGNYRGKIDGSMGKLTVQAEQRWLKGLGYYGGLIDGKRGPLTIKAAQGFLYDKGLYRNGSYSKAVLTDGKWGARSVRGLQAYINSQTEYYDV